LAEAILGDEQLTVKITADTTNAPASIDNVTQRLSALEQAFIKSTGAAETHAAVETKTGNTLTVTGEKATGLAGALEYLTAHWRTVAAGSEAAGLEASATGAKLVALTEVVNGLEKSFAPLIVAFVAFEAVAKAFEFVKGAAEASAGLQAQMETLGAAVETQGGDWEVIKGQVEAFIAVEAMATGFLRSELLPALNELVTAGHSVADSETILAVAEEVAIAHHKEVREVVGDLISLELGRGRAIEKLDPGVRALTQAHASYADKLELLHKHSEKQIENDKSAERANNRLKVEIEGVRKEIGDNLLPIMAAWDYTLLGAMENAQQFGKGVVHSFTSVVMAAQGIVSAMRAVPDAIGAAWDAVKSGRLKDAPNAMQLAAGADMQQAFEHLADAQGMSDLGYAEMWQKDDAYEVGRRRAKAAVDAHKAGLEDRIKNVKALVPPKEAKAAADPGSTTTSFTPADDHIEKTDQYALAQKRLEEALKRTDDGEKALAESIKTAGTVEEQRAAQAKYDAQVTIDLLHKKTLLTDAMKTEGEQQKTLQGQYFEAFVAAKHATEAYNDFGNAMFKSGDNSIKTQNRLAELKAAMDAANKSTDSLKKYIDELTKDLEKNGDALAVVNSKLDEFKNKAEEAFAAASRSWEQHHKKMGEALKEDLTTANMTNAEKVAFFGKSLTDMQALDAQYRAQKASAMAAESAAYAAEQATHSAADKKRLSDAMAVAGQIVGLFTDNEKSMEQVDAKYTEAYKGAIKDRETEYKNFITAVQGFETGFLDDILKKHVSFGDAIRNVFRKMVDDWIAAQEQMLLKSAFLKSANSPDGIFGKTLIAAGILPAPGASTGNPQLDAAIAARVTGEQHLAQSTTQYAVGQDRATQSVGAATQALGTFTSALERAASVAGSSGGSVGGLFGGGNGVFDPTSIGGADWSSAFSKDVNIDAVGGKAIGGNNALPTNITHVGGFSAAGAFQGLMIAQMVTGITGGNQTWGSVGGAIGGAFGGPLGAAAGAFLGGMFGHKDDPKKMPDVFNPAWGQADVDWNGAAGAQTFGKDQFTAASQYNVGQGGTPMYKLMEQWANSATASTDAQKALQDWIKRLEGGNPNSDFGVVSQKDGMATLANGQKISTDDLIKLEQQYRSTVGAGLASSALFQVTRGYPDPNIGRLSPNGTYTQVPITVTPGGGSSGDPGGSGSGGAGRSIVQGGGDTNVTVQVVLDGDVISTKVFPRIATSFGRQNSDLTAGSSTAYGNATRYART
jgi:hypothetical protein